ncbi:ankyrin repeat-containing domain protein [Mycena olivaceomarginata]|nr:ankyrin repeat-containing domain protein [Mycena olivaceomarginata]
MSQDFEELPPELILLHSPLLSIASLNALALTCRRLHEIIQPELDRRITPELGQALLLWAAASRPHIVLKLLSPPHSIHPSPPPPDGWRASPQTALHIAAEAGNTETASLLLNAGADPAAATYKYNKQPLHVAAENNDLEMMKLLLDHGAPVDAKFGYDNQHSENVLHHACSMGHPAMVELLLEHGANLECLCGRKTPLGFAVLKLRLEGADATVTVPISYSQRADLLYIALDLWPPSDRRRVRQNTPERLDDRQRELMALLMAHGASKATTMATVSQRLPALAKEVEYGEQEFLEVVAGMLKEAEDAIPDLVYVEKFPSEPY